MAMEKDVDMMARKEALTIVDTELDPSPHHDFTDSDHNAAPFSAPLHRKLKSRHIQMIAIGGIIGPGLFVGSGNALHLAGPGDLRKLALADDHEAGAFADSVNGVANTFVIAGTLYAGTEMVGITAGEAGNPRRAVPRAIRQVFWRILIFYVGMMFFIGILIPWNDKALLSKGSKTATSPLTIALSEAGIGAGASLINAVIVIAVISAGNSSLYVSSRTMLFMARNGKAPKILGKVNKAGVPWVALLFSNLIACIAFLSVSDSAGTVYEALITLSGVATFIVWGTISLLHIRFRAGLAAQNQPLSSLPFKALWYPYGTYLSLSANIFLIFFQGYTAFLNPFSRKDFVINYILLPVFLALVVGWKVLKGTRMVRAGEMDIWSGRREIDVAEGKVAVESGMKGWGRRVKGVVVG
ncbi:MAG: hypothetical protein Q9170_005871 [Blastenia crenularia]